MLGPPYLDDLQVHRDHIYQDYKVHLLQILQQHQMAIFLLHLLMETLQMEILPHLLQEVEVVVGAVPQIQVETLMGLPVQVEIRLLPPHLQVVVEEVVVHLHPLLRTKADQMGHKVPIFPLSIIIEAELQTPELLHKN